ncbi:ABC transporter permease [Lapillicoccus sp.]|uniref:ABC transporter permease n=1 Tax=Lapillicoccus sp. TaxID=1909287 RepID=UPI0025E45C9B|nr:ABC transporter permease [Lapillicoccus sp.]
MTTTTVHPPDQPTNPPLDPVSDRDLARTPAPSAPHPPGIPFARLIAVELRKMLDTRSGRWLLIAIGVVTIVVVGFVLFASRPQDLTLSTFVTGTATPQTLLLPLLGVLAVTSEWGQRNALVTFTLEPRRLRVMLAKLVGSMVLGTVAIAFAFLIATIGNGLGILLRNGDGSWALGAASIGGVVLSQLLWVAQGIGFGLLFGSTAVAIVSYLTLPTAWAIVGSMVTSLSTVSQWLDLSRAIEPLVAGQMSGISWAHLGVAAGLWVILPILVGSWRMMRREVK